MPFNSLKILRKTQIMWKIVMTLMMIKHRHSKDDCQDSRKIFTRAFNLDIWMKVKMVFDWINKKGNTSKTDGFFQNQAEFFKDFKAKTIVSKDIKLTDFSGLKVAVIGTDQHTVSNLEYIVQNAEFVKVFQISPVFILPQTEKGIQKLISHPLIIKNRRLFNHRIKSMLAIRYLDAQVQEQWLKRQLMPNCATKNNCF